MRVIAVKYVRSKKKINNIYIYHIAKTKKKKNMRYFMRLQFLQRAKNGSINSLFKLN